MRRLGEASGTRITLIAADRPGAARGEVLADSDSDPATMENHADRTEFLLALLGRAARTIHYSDTLGEDMMYVAVPVREDGRITTVVRDGHAAHPHERRPRRPVRQHRRSAPWSWP